jgi:hypothetical protein
MLATDLLVLCAREHEDRSLRRVPGLGRALRAADVAEARLVCVVAPSGPALRQVLEQDADERAAGLLGTLVASGVLRATRTAPDTGHAGLRLVDDSARRTLRATLAGALVAPAAPEREAALAVLAWAGGLEGLVWDPAEQQLAARARELAERDAPEWLRKLAAALHPGAVLAQR